MGVTCQILIKPSIDGKFILGQSIVGIVKYSLSKPTQYKSITLSLMGKGKCEWIQYKKKKGVGHIKYEGNEKIAEETILIDDNRTSLTINAGTYEYPFEINLPLNIPPSVKTETCEIYYHIALIFEKPGLLTMPKKFATKNLSIYPNVPVSIPDRPISFGLDKTIIKLFNKYNKQTINLKAKLDNGYFSPGKDSKIYLTVTNDSDVNVIIKTELISKIVYKDDCGNVKSEQAVIKELKTPKVPENCAANLFHIIPVWPDLYTVTCSKVMSREYKMKVTIRLPLPHKNATVEFPIVIGKRRNDEMMLMEEPPSYWEVMNEDYSKD